MILGFTGTLKKENNDFMASNSNIGHPYCNKCKLLPLSSFFPLQASLNHLFHNGNTTSLKVCYFILGMATFLVHVKFPFLLTQMWHISNHSYLSHMFIERVRFRTQDDILSLHSQTHNALHMISISKITLEHFCP